ncbi:hypothetical protein LINGRAHAP2_LOCUS18904 [Linum grandiflorum]
MMNDQGAQRRRRRLSLADMPPELLNLIYSKLRTPSSDELYRFELGEELGRKRREIPFGIPADIRKLLNDSVIVYRFKEKGWLLVKGLLARHLSCFNPLLPWPSCYIPLPMLYIEGSPNLPIAAAFSADPTTDSGDGDLRILVFYTRRFFSVIRIRRAGPEEDPSPEDHEKYMIFRWSPRAPVAAEYTGRKFFVLFESGDILVWDTQEGGLRRMLIANPPINFSIRERNQVRAVGEFLVITWNKRLASSFRLVSVEEIQIVDNYFGDDNVDRIEELEEGVRTTTYFVREDVNVKIEKDRCSLFLFCVFCLLPIIIFIGVVLSEFFVINSGSDG